MEIVGEDEREAKTTKFWLLRNLTDLYRPGFVAAIIKILKPGHKSERDL
jgi:hypothetical protein